ncbi:hypothetical protein HanIR_Chr08g0356141 [Helianthus annuus]|nr:hypothetical protein HanIR_Chr08g0356141 [Helianthus annuus]
MIILILFGILGGKYFGLVNKILPLILSLFSVLFCDLDLIHKFLHLH